MFIISPDEVINELKKVEINMTRSTLLRYENQGLIPKPERGGGGPGGRWTNYPKGTVAEAYATWCFLHGNYGSTELKRIFDNKMPKITPAAIKVIRLQGDYEKTKREYAIRKVFGKSIEEFSEEEEKWLKESKFLMCTLRSQPFEEEYDKLYEAKNSPICQVSEQWDVQAILSTYWGIWQFLVYHGNKI